MKLISLKNIFYNYYFFSLFFFIITIFMLKVEHVIYHNTISHFVLHIINVFKLLQFYFYSLKYLISSSGLP